jgi:hypothetical protein
VKRIVSRVAQRHRVREAARVADAAATVLDAKAPIVVIIGEQDSGKSHLAKWCGQLCAANRMRNVHIDIGKSKSAIDLLDVLRYVRDGRLTLPGARSVRDPNWPLPTEAFKYFTRHLALRLRGRDVNSLAGQPLDFDDVAIRLADSKWPEENMVTNTMQDFRGALTDAVANQPTLLTFDHLENLDDTTLNQWLSDELFLPIANGAIPGLRLLLVVPRKTFEDKLSRLRLMNPAPVKVEVGYFKRSDFEALARFLCRQFSETTLETLQPTFAKILKARGGIDGVGYRADVLKAIEALCCALELP